MELGSKLELREWRPAEEFRAAGMYPYDPPESVKHMCYCSFTNSVYAAVGFSIVRLTNNVVSTVAGDAQEAEEHPVDGALSNIGALVSDGRGAIYVVTGWAEEDIIKIHLPDAWRGDNAAQDRGGALMQYMDSAIFHAQLHGAAPGAEGQAGAPAAADAAAGEAAAQGEPRLRLLAGDPDSSGRADGWGTRARFTFNRGMAAEADGSVIVADGWGEATALRRVSPDGAVTTLVPDLTGKWCNPVILPNGYLALIGWLREQDSLLVVDLGLQPPPLRPPSPEPEPEPQPAGPPPRTLRADMGALLEGRLAPGSSDVTIIVGDRRFPAHRLILSTRCDYFAQQLGSAFPDGANAAELTLQDTSPEAFEMLLRYIYTGSADIPGPLAAGLAELADRLLLPELCAEAQDVVIAGVGPETVVDGLLWAERRGPAFARSLAALKAWYLEHHEEVHAAAPASLERLAASPKLTAELLVGVASCAKRQRTA
ncbi:hypothetical protein HYH03_006396 [Edaphochlamys debaryana]|uniref:BTB domain-containing protein n=1 Tax=Edaphochlamys debaryana TaxID=47281 RepID=A0A835Y3P2_9CHLO|nr:hypothetical protein HYH03_006396 [Edaphochlamys debaryana]|eukprot:KAG2495450.1 hypothetical protein HYH03_006396 [Edaphochlamys debaryana]